MHTNTPNAPAGAPSAGTNKIQGAAAPSEQPPKKGKDKKIWSCHSCRRRKLKCDRSDPCGACQARGEGHSCTWEEGQRPEKNNRESLEQLPNLIQKLTQEVKELKASNADLVQNFRHKDGAAPLLDQSATFRKTSDSSPLVGRSGTISLDSFSSSSRLPPAPFLTMCSALPQGSDPSYQSPDRPHWTLSRIAALLPESNLLWGLISHFFHVSASLTGFIDVSQLLSELEEVEHVRRGMDNRSSTVSVEHLDVKVSLILSCASLAAVNLDTAKAEELGVGRVNIDAFSRELWKKARMLITHLESDSFPTGSEASMPSMPRAHPSLAESYTDRQQAGSVSPQSSALLLRIVAIKIILLLAARSFAAPSEYLKLHLDAISSAVEASLDSPWDDDVPLEEREWRWQLWSSLCVLDWTSPGIYHNGSYFIRPEMHCDPPSKVPGVPDNGAYSPMVETEHLERLSQTRYFLEYAVALASLSRKAEDCIVRPGPIVPGHAAELCSELDALDHKLSFYHLFGGGAGRGGELGALSNSVNGVFGARGRQIGSSSSHTPNEHRIPIQRALQIQNVHLSLMLGLTRFKLFRHEAFHLMHDPSSSGPLRTMCMDTCMDACILVLSHCRNIGVRAPPQTAFNRGADGMRNMMRDVAGNAGANTGENGPYPGIFRRVIQPASSAALVGQVLLHASQSTDGNSSVMMQDKRATAAANTNTNSNNTSRPASVSGNSANNDFLYNSYAEPYVVEGFAPYNYWNGAGPSGAGAAPWSSGRFGREKVGLLQWHVSAVIGELETLQATSPLAKHKLALHRQCM
ncbi:MAG: hypothetical protein Q9216_005235 [Gyalolechia sp. 2 TL-2023]